MNRLLALLPLYFFLAVNNLFAQTNDSSIINSFSDRVFPGKGYQPLGDIKWKFKTDGKIFSSPIAKKGIVYIGSEDGFLYAIEEKSGNLKWKFKTNGAIHSSPSIYENTIFFGSFDGYYYAINTTTGKEVWKFKTGGENWYREVRMLDLYPNDPLTDDLWDYFLSSPVVYKDDKSASLYIGSWDAKLYAINCKTGKEKWKFVTEDKIGFKGIQSSVTVANGMVYFGARDPYFFALDSETGKLIWKYDAENSWILSSAVTLNNIIYVGTSDTYALLALDAKTGKELYRFRTSGYVYSSPAISGNTVYFGDFTGNFFALDILSQGKISNFISTDGRKKHAAKLLNNDQLDFVYAAKDSDLSQYKETKKVMEEFYKLGPIVSSPYISNNTVYFGSGDGYFYAIGL